MSRVEFFMKGVQRPFCIVDAEFQPSTDDLINIEGKTYRVLGRSFTVDYAHAPNKSMRCNVIVEEMK